jgi:hypothetical protein
MRRLIAATAYVAFLSMCFGIAGAQPTAPSSLFVHDPDPIFGKTPDAENWIRLVLLTPRTREVPIFLISPTRFNVAPPEVLIQLSKAQYDLVVQYTRDSQCAPRELASQLFLDVTEHTKAGLRLICRLTHREACRYLDGMTKISKVVWKDKWWDTLRLLRYGC